MPEDPIAPDDDTDEAPVVHDDITKRLLDYRRRQREEGGFEAAGAPLEPAAVQGAATTAIATEDLVDLTEIEEPHLETVELGAVDEPPEPTDVVVLEGPDDDASAPSAGGDDEDLRERLERIEGSLEKIAAMVAAIRQDFLELAIRADERIAEIEDALVAARGTSEG